MLQLNSIFIPVEEFVDEIGIRGPHRIIGIDRINRVVALFKLRGELNAPFNFCLASFEKFIADKKLQPGELSPPGYMLRTDLSGRDEKILEDRKKLIDPFLKKSDMDWIFDANRRGELVSQQMETCNRPRKSILRWLYRYLEYGMIPGALNCGYSEKGGFGKGKTVGENKRGRPKNTVITGHDISLVGINITPEIRSLFKTFKELHYSVKNGRNLQHVYQKVIDAFFSKKVLSPTGQVETIPNPNRPSIRQFRYWHKVDGDLLEELKKRQGLKRFNLKNRGLGGRVEQNCIGPCDKFELDSTVLDLYCVSSFNRSWIIGRPILYFVVDTYSRMIVGFHLALSGPSWKEARVALFHSFTDKVSFCAQAGVEISPDEWPCHYLPQTILVDRGEMRAHKPRGLIDGLGVEVDLAPPFRGDFKSVVERRFRIINDVAIKWIPGAVRARGRERGERDYRLDAVLTLAEVKKIIIRAVLDHNNHSEFPDLLTRQMVIDGVQPTPLSIWNWGVVNALGSPRQENPRNIFCHLLPKGTAQVRADGIWWGELRYTCNTEIDENWRAKARNHGNWKVEIRFLPDLTDNIWIFNEREGSFECCEFLAPDERYKGIRVDEYLDAVSYLKLEAAGREPLRLGSKIDSEKYFDDIIIKALELKRASLNGLSKQAQLADIDKKRSFEKMLLANPSLTSNTNLLEALCCKSPPPIDHDEAMYRDEVAQLLSGIVP